MAVKCRLLVTRNTRNRNTYAAFTPDVGFWKDLDELHDKARVERTFTPDNDEEKRERRYKGWKKAVKRSLEWAKEDAE